MKWNWQEENWPHFSWDAKKLARAEMLFAKGAGLIAGITRHLDSNDQEIFTVEVMSREAIGTSAIEGEYLNRESVQSSIRRQLGLSTESFKATPAEKGIAEMMVNLYHSISLPLDHETLFRWHRMILNERHDLKDIGCYRSHADPMQIVSGPDYARKVHYEAPPSSQIIKEMDRFIEWFNQTQPRGVTPIATVTKAALAHLWFESIHPFEDGNGRIGRAIAEKALSQGISLPVLTALAGTLHKRRKEYYHALEMASQGLEVTDWLLWFGSAVIEAQQRSQAQVEFLLGKTRLLDKIHGQLNTRQEKTVFRMFQEGSEGFKGGLSAKNYASITGALPATTTRDLVDLVEKGVLYRTGELKSTRYHLTLQLQPVKTITIEDII
jgi:Fic family protein